MREKRESPTTYHLLVARLECTGVFLVALPLSFEDICAVEGNNSILSVA